MISEGRSDVVAEEVSDCSDGAVGERFANAATAREFHRQLKDDIRTHAQIASEQLYFANAVAQAKKDVLPPALQEAWDLIKGFLGYTDRHKAPINQK